MLLKRKKGQLSLELILLITAVVLGGAVVGYSMINTPSFSGSHVDGIKKLSFSGFTGNHDSIPQNNNKIFNNTTINDTNISNINNTSNSDNNISATNTTNTTNISEELPDLVPVSMIVNYNNGTPACYCYKNRCSCNNDRCNGCNCGMGCEGCSCNTTCCNECNGCNDNKCNNCGGNSYYPTVCMNNCNNYENSCNCGMGCEGCSCNTTCCNECNGCSCEGCSYNADNHYKHGYCKNNTNLIIHVLIENEGAGTIPKDKNVDVALYDNNNKVDEVVAKNIGNNQWEAVFNYKITTNSEHNQHRYQNSGDNHQQQYRYKGGNYIACNHTLKAVVDPDNKIRESNEFNNDIYVELYTLAPLSKKCESCNHLCNNTVSHNSHVKHTNNYFKDIYIKFLGNSNGIISSSPVSDGKSISGKVDIRVKGTKVAKYDVDGEAYGKIIVNGNGQLYVGNIDKINNLELKMNGNSNDNVEYSIDVPKIGSLDAGVIDGNAQLKLDGTNIGNMHIKRLNGGSYLKLSNTNINKLTIEKIDGNTNVIFENINVTSMTIDKINKNANVVFKNAYIKSLTIKKDKGNIIYSHSYVNGKYYN